MTAAVLTAALLLAFGPHDGDSDAADQYFELGQTPSVTIGGSGTVNLFVPDNAVSATSTIVSGSDYNGIVNVGYYEDAAHTVFKSGFSVPMTLTSGSQIQISGTNYGGLHTTGFELRQGSLVATGDVVLNKGDSLSIESGAVFKVNKSLTVGSAPALLTGLANDVQVAGKVTLGSAAYVLVYGDSAFLASNITGTPVKTAFQIKNLGNGITSKQMEAVGENYAVIYANASTVPIVYQRANELKDFKLLGWFYDGALQSRVNPNALPVIGADSTLYGQFEAKKYLVNFSYDERVNWFVNGVGQGSSKAVEYNYGTTLKVHASVLPGFTGTPVLTVNGGSYSADANWEVTADATFRVNADSIRVAEIPDDPDPSDGGSQGSVFNVSLGSRPGFALSAYGGSTTPVQHGGSFSFILTAQTGFSLSDVAVKVNGNTVAPANGVYNIRNIVGDQNVEIVPVGDRIAIELVSDPGITFRYSVNGGEFQDYTGPFSADKSDVITIRASGVDEGQLPLWPDGSKSTEFTYVASDDVSMSVVLASASGEDDGSDAIILIAAVIGIAIAAAVGVFILRAKRVL
ncbi:MAG: hypothetical protein LBT41_04675 [Candidatus Methanoplasma sp.]|jgi:hypothetical protein|nr:hypothetical protein [Candidatus Methanoplasma sp.]